MQNELAVLAVVRCCIKLLQAYEWFLCGEKNCKMCIQAWSNSSAIWKLKLSLLQFPVSKSGPKAERVPRWISFYAADIYLADYRSENIHVHFSVRRLSPQGAYANDYHLLSEFNIGRQPEWPRQKHKIQRSHYVQAGMWAMANDRKMNWMERISR